jgi:solute carrier family 35, member F5
MSPPTVTVPPRESPRASEESLDDRYSQEVLQDDPIYSPASVVSAWDDGQIQESKPWSRIRHTVGIVLLLATVFLWTASNFLASVRRPR